MAIGGRKKKEHRETTTCELKFRNDRASLEGISIVKKKKKRKTDTKSQSRTIPPLADKRKVGKEQKDEGVP